MTNEVIYIHLIPSLFTLLICLSLGFYAIKIKKYAPENRLLAMICVLMALSSSGVIAGHTLTSATTMTRIFVSLCLIVVPVAIRLAYTLTEKKPPRLFCVVCILCLTIMALIWTGMEPSPLWGWAIFLLGISMIAPSLNPVSDSAPSSGTHLALAGLVVLIFTASLGPFVSYLPDLGFIPVIIFAAGLSYRTPVLRKDLFAYMALALVMVPILDDLIIAISFREEIFKVSTLEWLYSKGSLILISLFFGSVITTLSLRRFGRSARASIFSLTCIIFVTYVLGELLQAILPQHMGQQILAINTPWFAMLPGLIAHLVYQYTSRKKAWIHLFFYFLGLITALAISSGMHLVHTEKTAGDMAIFFFIIPAILFVLVYAVITLKGSLQRQGDPVKKRQLIMLSSGMAMALGFTCIDIISWITAQDLYMINFQFIPLTIVGLGIFYRNLFSGNIYIRRRIVARSIRLIIIIIYLITIPLVFLILKDYTPGYISSCIIPYSIPALISFMVACFLSLFVFGLEQNRTEGILFSLMCFVYAALNLDIVLVNIVPDKALALLISRVDHFFLVLFALGVNLHLAFL
ncbi:MAG: hypothetical protein U9P80_04955, partial [Thermodesulfobacteriota bacterium]|nr:hypothetical protein [Thermodesulfobacteriota bacterium]